MGRRNLDIETWNLDIRTWKHGQEVPGHRNLELGQKVPGHKNLETWAGGTWT
jgi:hypothetical protein